MGFLKLTCSQVDEVTNQWELTGSITEHGVKMVLGLAAAALIASMALKIAVSSVPPVQRGSIPIERVG